MNRSTLLAPPRRGLAALAVVGLLVSFQPVTPAAGGSGAPPATTRLRPRQLPAETASPDAEAPTADWVDEAWDQQQDVVDQAGLELLALEAAADPSAPSGVPSNDTCAGAIPLTVNVPVAGTNGEPDTANDYILQLPSGCFPGGGGGETTAPGRDVVYSFTTPMAGQYSFRVWNYVPVNAGSSDLVLYLSTSCPVANPGSQVVVPCAAASNINSAATGTQSEEITCIFLSAGTTIFVFVDEASAGSGGTFAVVAEQQCDSQEFEPNDTPATADPLGCGLRGDAVVNFDVDYHTLGTPAAGSRVFAAIETSTATLGQDFDLRVTTTADTVESDSGDNDDFLGPQSGNVGGTIATGTALFLQVTHNFPSGGRPRYRLYSVVRPAIESATPESESNDTIATADSAVNNYFTGALAAPSPSTDVDVYGFQATAGDLIFISLDGDPLRNNTPLNARLDLFDAAGNLLFTVNDGNASSNTTPGTGSLFTQTPNSPAEALVFRAFATTNYFVRVSAGSTSATTAAGDYLLSISRNCQTGGGGLGPVGGTDTVGIYGTASGAFFLKNANASGGADAVFTFGAGGTNVIPLTGDWDGDGDDTAGIYDTTTGAFFLRNANSNGGADIVLTFGPGGASFIPLSGDWDGDGDDTVGIYDTTTGAFFLRNTNTNGGADVILTFGPGGSTFIPLTGDWDGDGDDTVGIYDTTSGAFFLRNMNTNGGADLVFTFGAGGAGVDPLAGDWDGDGDDTVGIHIQSSGAFFLRNTNSSGGADLVFGFGAGGSDFVPVTGDWDGT
jgi:hypothetical protein